MTKAQIKKIKELEGADYELAVLKAAPKLLAAAEENVRLRNGLINAIDWLHMIYETPITTEFQRCVEIIKLGARAVELESRDALKGKSV